ncbi:AAA family ATPase [Nitrosomonas sp. Is37]|uniref:bifunctional aminoglycoside phosphotransferase/ATP-binding protein n=1 Tax=Nitrosomonas sp. Is37 TaxID=3080535 RepID=UPI00294B19E7|nr:AAA family ATPase [Nitrosomonas sp. Is37]MDV6345071.1 AAA family ATPase [Nitrosomonas sp. Is37]
MKEEIAQKQMIEALLDPACYPHPARRIQHVETHISHVLLTGDFVYKLKKPLNLGFLDFSTLDKRRFYCEEELRLNRRLAPDIYLEVVTFNGEAAAPRLNGPGPVLDYAVKMDQFDPEATLDRLDDLAQLSVQHVDMIASTLADFHLHIPFALLDSPWGKAETIWQPVAHNFEHIIKQVGEKPEGFQWLETVHQWSAAEHNRLLPDFELRRAQGYVRECHGDLHLGNMAWEAGKLLIFDCIEFNPALRWIDVMSEVAFCYMDLLYRNHHDLASRFLNCYLERTGDYAGMKLLRYYAVYRAMVRAKVAFIRAAQSGLSSEMAEYERQQGLDHLRLADRLTRVAKPILVITHGLSGSGKTVFSQSLTMQFEMISLRSDIERKRLAGLDALAKSASSVESGIYSREFSRRTYDYLAELAETLLGAGWHVLVDATFIARWQRELFQQIAMRCGVVFYILDFSVPEALLRQRVQARSAAGRDASEADITVLELQLRTQEALIHAETHIVIEATTVESVAAQLKAAVSFE